jgi:hypothetical protein
MILTTALGALTGLLGTAFSAYTDSKKAANDLAVEKVRGETSIALAKLELDKIEKMGASQITQLVAQADEGNYAVSMDSDKATYSDSNTSQWVKNALGVIDVARGAIRPWLTISTNLVLFLLVGVAVAYTGPELMKLKGPELIDIIVYLAISTGLWWFGVRVVNRK